MHQSVVSPKPAQSISLPSSLLSSSSSSSSQGSWDFLTMQHKTTNNDNSVYVHPLAKQQPSIAMSLEMCTETVGDENGSYIDSSLEEYSYLMLSLMESDTQQSCSENKAKIRKAFKKIKPSTFPPPLTNCGGGGVQMRAHREGGRLVIKAVVVVSSCFKAERREDGRLTLSLPPLINKEDYYNLDHTNKLHHHDEEEEEVVEKKRNKEEQVGRRRRIIGGGDQWGRCMSGTAHKRIPSLPFCVAIS